MGGLVALEELADLAGRACAETDVGRGLESEGHVFGPFVWLSRAAGRPAAPSEKPILAVDRPGAPRGGLFRVNQALGGFALPERNSSMR